MFLYLKQWPQYIAMAQERDEAFPTRLPQLIASEVPALSERLSELVAAYDDFAAAEDSLGSTPPR